MNEVTIPAALSGEEIVNALLDKVKKTLIRNCDLNPVLAYDSFEATIKISIRMKDSGRVVNVDAVVPVKSEDEVDEDAFLREAEAHIGAAPPNQVRVETDQAVPTLVTDGEGKQSVRPVKYAKKEADNPLDM